MFDWLRERGQADEGRRAAIELYLRRLAALPEAKQVLPGLHLIDNGGHWRPAAELCATTDEIERRHVLCQSQREILAGLIVSADRLRDARPAGLAAGAVGGPDLTRLLDDFFQPWRGKVPGALIGYFVSGQAPPDDAQLWQALRESDQVSIDVARALMLDHLPVLAKQLSSGLPEGLAKALGDYDVGSPRRCKPLVRLCLGLAAGRAPFVLASNACRPMRGTPACACCGHWVCMRTSIAI